MIERSLTRAPKKSGVRQRPWRRRFDLTGLIRFKFEGPSVDSSWVEGVLPLAFEAYGVACSMTIDAQPPR
jgi:hypothetical protein